MEESFEEARKRLKDTTEDEGKYQAVLKGLILQVSVLVSSLCNKTLTECFQGLYTIMEKDIKVTCRSKDVSLVEKAKDEAQKEFNEQAGYDVKISVAGDMPEQR